MKIYFPLIVFPVTEPDGQKICDYVMQGFANEEDARELYPEAEIQTLEFPDPNPMLN